MAAEGEEALQRAMAEFRGLAEDRMAEREQAARARAKRRAAAVNWRPPAHILEAAKACARSAGMPLSQFVTQAVAARVRRWQDPVTGERVALASHGVAAAEGWLCCHASHGDTEIPAAQCLPGKRSAAHRRSWYHPDRPGEGWVG